MPKQKILYMVIGRPWSANVIGASPGQVVGTEPIVLASSDLVYFLTQQAWVDWPTADMTLRGMREKLQSYIYLRAS